MATINLGRIKPVFRGAYAGGTAYVVDDIVTHGNETFICIQAGTGNATSNASYWTKLAAKGTDGADGTDVGTTLTTQGDMLYRDGSGLQRLAKGTAGQELRINSGATAPEWFTPAAASTDVERIVSGSHSGTELIVDNCFTTAYEIYELHFYNIIGDVYYRLQFRGGGSSGSNITDADYRYRTNYFIRNSSGSTETGENSWNDTSFRISYDGSSANYGHYQTIYIPEPTKAGRTGFWGHRNQVSTSTTGHAESGGYFNGNNVVTGFRFFLNNGNSFTTDYVVYGKKIS